MRRLDRKWPYAVPLLLLAISITLRLDWADMGDWYNLRFRTHAVAWFFVLGWLVRRSVTVPQKLLTTVICLASAPGVFMNPQREFFIAFGSRAARLVHASCRCPVRLVRPCDLSRRLLAAASMWIFISHFMIWPPMKELFIVEVAYPLTVLASLAVWHDRHRCSPIGPLPDWRSCDARIAADLDSNPRPTAAAVNPRVGARCRSRLPFSSPS